MLLLNYHILVKYYGLHSTKLQRKNDDLGMRKKE